VRGQSLILDGTFAEKPLRAPVYELAKRLGVHVTVLRTQCNDEGYIRARLWRRRLDHSRSDHEVIDFRVFETTYGSIISNPIEQDHEITELGADIITFQNHGDRRVVCSEDASEDAKTIAHLIRISPLMSTHI
jgi:hypothetical protein